MLEFSFYSLVYIMFIERKEEVSQEADFEYTSMPLDLQVDNFHLKILAY